MSTEPSQPRFARDNVASLDAEASLAAEAPPAEEWTVIPALRPARAVVDPATVPYPKELAVMVGEATFTAEDYPALRLKHGKYSVLLLRGTGGISACLAVTSIIKVGILGRHTKAVPVKAVAEYLSPDEYALIETYDEALVCAPPLDAGMAIVLADIAMSEESFFGMKLPMLISLDAIIGFTAERVTPAVGEMIRYLASVTAAYRSRIEQVEPPTGEWNIYTRGGALPPPDRLTNAIKGFANHSTRVYPPLPPVDDEEVDALLRIHDMLVGHQMVSEAGQLITEALRSPMFARLCHRPEIFAADRVPRLEAQWPNFGPAMLDYLFSEEVTHAARRDAKPEPVTLAAPYVLTLKEVIALGVPHAPRDEAHAFQRLDTYVGGYLAELDLRHTLITGSAMAAALIVTDVERTRYKRTSWARYQNEVLPPQPTLAAPSLVQTEDSEDEAPEAEAPKTEAPAPAEAKAVPSYEEWRAALYETYLAAHYPPTKTVPRDRDAYVRLVTLIREHPDETSVEYKTDVLDDGSVVLTLTARREAHDHSAIEELTAVLDVQGGADVDMSVVVESNEEFDAVAQAHYAVIRARYPEAVLKKVLREDPADPRYNWSITCAGSPTFRPVELYRASFNHVVTHHVGMVSGAYTAALAASEPPQFVMSARLAISMARLATPNYYYFASRKTSPQHVVMKYKMRGFSLESFPSGIQAAIGAVFSQDPSWRAEDYDEDTLCYPALYGKGNFSAYSIAAELGAIA